MRSISRRRAVPAATALSLALAGWAGASAAPAGASTGEAGIPAATPDSYDVTLITGDVVHYTDGPGTKDVVTVDLADEDAGGVQVQTRGDDTYVVPVQAMPLLAADRLDPRLFDVTRLVAMGYDDAHASSVPVIVTASGTGRSARPPAAPGGSTAVRTLRSIDGTALRTDKDEARTFWTHVAPGKAPQTLGAGIGKVWLDGQVEASLANETAQIRATDAWQQGYDGSGVKVAVLDSGVDLDHPDLVGQVLESQSFVAGQGVDDGNGHGTHTASTIAGTGAASGGTEKGAAPGAELLVGKVLGDGGTGEDSDVIAGMEWAKAQGADVVSMSLGSPDGSDGEDPISQALDALSADGGPLYVVAAGNAYDPGTIGSPGAAAAALTVGAVDKVDERADFSSQGPLTGTHSLKPDVSAPGVDVRAAASQSVPGWTGGLYRTMSGTSMATPLVAGAAAILKERHPDWTGARLKDALMTTADRADETPFEVGTGRVDVAAALGTTVEATGSVETAAYDWPNADAKAATRTVTYRNDGDADVTLALSTGTDSAAYALSASSVTVPAHGTAAVTLTIDPSRVAAGTTFSGQVTATDTASGAVVAHTAYGLFKEDERYDLTIKLKDRSGKPVADTVTLHDPASTDPVLLAVGADGEATVRLPPGRYVVSSYLDVPGDAAGELGEALLISPEVTLDADHPGGTAVLDATTVRKAYAVPPRAAETTQTVFGLSRHYADDPAADWTTSDLLPGKYDALYLSPTATVDDGSMKAFVTWRMRQKALTARTGKGDDVALVPQTGGVFHDGSSTLRTVYAGQGAAADYDGLDVRGKAVLVDLSAAVTANQRAQAASAAGAAMLVVVNDTPGRLYSTSSGAGDLTIASVAQEAGARLVAEARSPRGGVLHVTQRQYPDYTYDLVETFDGGIPNRSLAYRPSNGHLARVESSYDATPGTTGYGGRYFVPAWGPALGGDAYELYGRTVTEYVTPSTGDVGTWWAQHQGLGAAASYWENGYEPSYPAGRPTREGWFATVQAPRLAQGYSVSYTKAGTLTWNVPTLSGGDDGHAGFGGTAQSAFYRGDTQVAKVSARAGRAVGMTAGSYRLVLTGQRSTAAWSTSTATSTTWGFDYTPLPSDGAARADLPLLNLGYDVDTDLQGAAKAGKRLPLTLTAATFPGVVTATSAALQVSYDEGATWQPVTLKRAGAGRWTTDLRTPRDATSVSLRASAQAPGGLTVQQDVIRAVALR
ncbi:S8 family peptidase [Luteimicrobium sp. DT211]|uniref:S8 family peptidase n=1 Tax=Luteimicrobium sp. DT211 TaxID=3393412 RepID=UPI003CF8222E